MNVARFAGVLLLLSLAACRRGPPHGKIVGDAYLVVDLGREVDLAGIDVHLVKELEDDEETPRVENLDTILANICVQRDRFIARAREEATARGAAATDSLATLARDAYARGWRARNRLLQDAVLRTVRTNDRAQFAIDSIQPGEYRLWADTVIDAEHWTWLEPVEIEKGDSIRLNLSTGNVDDNPFRCKAPV
jgi:hypothetical protein